MTKDYWLAILERAIKTAAQTFLASVGTTATLGGINWPVVGSTVAVATLLSLVTSLASLPLAKPGPAAFGPESVD